MLTKKQTAKKAQGASNATENFHNFEIVGEIIYPTPKEHTEQIYICSYIQDKPIERMSIYKEDIPQLINSLQNFQTLINQ